ncbi:hypothetical protein [Kordia sp.]|uniref:hypothetical protein n=1 Tax=Kordia sp. TaxID=1965332 RepID=UPI003D265A3B
MQLCKTNKLSIQINFKELLTDYSIVKFSTTENYIKFGALVLDEISTKLKAKSIVFERGKSFYALFDKKIISRVDLARELEKIEYGDKLSFRILSLNEIKEINEHSISQLVVNSIASPKHEKLTYNNLTGKLYLFNTNHLKISTSKDKEQIFQIVGLEFYIDLNSCLQLNVRTFSSLLLSKSMDFSIKKISSYPKYTFVHSTKTLKRVLPSEKISIDSQYILKQTLKNGAMQKSSIPFLDFSNLKEFKNSKIGILTDVLNTINHKLSKYIKLNLHEVKINKTIRHSNVFDFKEFSKDVFLIDGINDEDSSEHLETLKNELKKLIFNSNIKVSKTEDKNGFNIKLIHDKSFYLKYEKIDPYKSSSSVQHITLEDFKVNSKASLKAIIKELVIKNDINKEQISIINWSSFNYKNKWIFGMKDEMDFFFLTIEPNGKIKFEKFEANLFNQNEYDELCTIYDEENNIEFIVKDDIGNVNIIVKTNNYTIPEYEEISSVLEKESEKIVITKAEVINLINQIFDKEKTSKYNAQITLLNTWDKESLLNCFTNRSEKKKLVEKIQENTGEILKSYFRDKKRYEILDSQLDIHSFNQNGGKYYFVGIKGKGIQQTITRASIIREIKVYKNSEYIFDKLLPLMNVDFVKNGDLTVLPFPIKYLRELKRVQESKP